MCPDQDTKEYLQEISEEIETKNQPNTKTLFCFDGFSKLEREVTSALGYRLRKHLEDDKQSFSLLLIGSYPVFLMKFGPNDMSALTDKDQMYLPDFTLSEMQELVNQIAPGFWNNEQIQQIHKHSGGHPHLMKLILSESLRTSNHDISEAAKNVVNALDFFMSPILLNEMQKPEVRKILLDLLQKEQGLYFARGDNIVCRLFFIGILKVDKQKLIFRCSIIRDWVKEEMERLP